VKRSLFGIAAIVAFAATPAFAADMALKALPYGAASASPAAAVYSWTGCYIGGNVGGGWANESATRLNNPNANFPVGDVAIKNQHGVLGGGQIGCDYQLNQVVLGVVGSLDAANLKGTTPELGVLGTELSTHSTTINWTADVGGRVGIAWNSWLPYAKGGAAWISLRDTGIDTSLPGGAFEDETTQSKTLNGWFIGGGAEFKIAPNLSAFAEYDYYRFDGTVRQSEIVGPAVGAFHDVGYSGNISIVKAGLNYRFNWTR